MSIQVYNCGEDGDFEIFTQGINSVSSTETCPSCGDASPHVFRSGGRMNIVRTWNDRACDEQRNKLTMVTASQEAFSRNQEAKDERCAKKNSDALYAVAVKLEENEKSGLHQRKAHQRDYQGRAAKERADAAGSV